MWRLALFLDDIQRGMQHIVELDGILDAGTDFDEQWLILKPVINRLNPSQIFFLSKTFGPFYSHQTPTSAPITPMHKAIFGRKVSWGRDGWNLIKVSVQCWRKRGKGVDMRPVDCLRWGGVKSHDKDVLRCQQLLTGVRSYGHRCSPPGRLCCGNKTID